MNKNEIALELTRLIITPNYKFYDDKGESIDTSIEKAQQVAEIFNAIYKAIKDEDN